MQRYNTQRYNTQRILRSLKYKQFFARHSFTSDNFAAFTAITLKLRSSAYPSHAHMRTKFRYKLFNIKGAIAVFVLTCLYIF